MSADNKEVFKYKEIKCFNDVEEFLKPIWDESRVWYYECMLYVDNPNGHAKASIVIVTKNTVASEIPNVNKISLSLGDVLAYSDNRLHKFKDKIASATKEHQEQTQRKETIETLWENDNE